MKAGFSTGSIAGGDVDLGLRIASHPGATAIEVSALRESELHPVLGAIDGLFEQLRKFDYVSFHAPSRLQHMFEADLVDKLQVIAEREWTIVVHPDIITDFGAWRNLANCVCIENMDKRKPMGRTVPQLAKVFDALPHASFCFDIGHARQVDPTMQEAYSLVEAFADRLKQVHMSYVNTRSRHERLNYECWLAYRAVIRQLPTDVPIILETPIAADQAGEELAALMSIVTPGADWPAPMTRVA